MLRRTLVAAAMAIGLAAPVNAAELEYAGTTPALTMDPHATNDFVTTGIYRQVYDSLVGLTLDMDIVPGLATEWTYVGDNTWRFNLRDDVTFHDGSPLTVDDVVFSITRAKDSPFYTSLFGNIIEARPAGGYSVDVLSDAPDPTLPRKMARMFIMSKPWAEEHGVVEIPDLGAEGSEAYSIRHANGTGPMKLIEHDQAVRTVFEKNADYWGDFPGNVTKATYRPIGTAPTRVAALLSGEVDLIVDLPIQDIARIESTSGVKVAQEPQLSWMQLELDGTRDVALDTFNKDGTPIETNPFKDVKVRLALAHAIDAEAIVDRVMRGNARVVGEAGTPGLGGYQPDLDHHWEYDVAKAKALLAEAGYPDGFATTLNCPLERYVNTEEICRAVAQLLARIGVDVRVNGLVWPEFARMLVNGPSSSFHLISAGPNSWDIQDSITATMMTRNAEKKEGFFNWALYSNPIVDKVAFALPDTVDEAERQALYHDALEAARETVSAIYLHQPMITFGMRDNVTAATRGDATLTLQNVTVAE